ncbi:putative Sugar phosphate isomerase/epimerase [Vibrio nigripulchritudo SFn27]|uniref:Putative Sugar phosphate isomerase/epimerase n=1 Tax=Vibrio nigripulchritudo TaxID=28173 RepID=U4KBY4_9VIBR|nr:sugar phosphate isomerase/epimerase [Vibrio nigripulchritudo]CCN82358.1 putative Sugar phosphate isomerase/epimerase [Vibrio nigripulchritudo BLFn1]CCN91344.1 putative Sugar phosphate isomerase/epimerase [Vibrio nigripulchritudo SFn27]CCN97509.1 putative Sugar phosphate isomerase/epimerase [Vibrio nigripulchritudo ENn2]CCO38651.1 putative Sugar phosphate isomerase/epimerase [Vibrio nigripulchritudo SFn135]CCO55056.1 putative Sugar phosphate isomerase/epimerase [Vibrio nigripulchritudo Wn13]
MSSKIALATCPCSWGVWYPKDHMQPNWQKFLDEASLCGFRNIELGPYGYLPTDIGQLQYELDAHHLQVCSSAHMSDLIVPNALDNIKRDINKICPLLEALSAKYFVFMDGDSLYKHPSDRNLSLKDWKHVVSVIGETAKIVKEEYGLEYVFHPHISTCIENEHQILRLLNDTHPDYVNLCFDTGHHLYTGGVPEDFIREFGPRIHYYHLKDMSQSIREKVKQKNLSDDEAFELGVMVPLGEGAVNFHAIKQELEKQSFKGFAVIEQDIYPDIHNMAYTHAKNSFDYARRLGLGTP